MNERISKMAYAVLSTDTFVKPVREACADANELKDAVAIANGIRRYLLKQYVEIREDEWICDRYRMSGCAYPSDYYRCCGHNTKNAYWSTCCYRSHPNDLYYWGWTHVSLDYGYVLTNGLKAYLKRVDASIQAHTGDEKKIRLLEGMKVCLYAIQERVTLISREALMQAESATGSERTRLLAIAQNLSRAPMEPALTFFEAVQAVWTMFLVAPDSLGRIDQYLYSYYRHDTDAGTLSRERALELLEELFVKVHESQVDNRELPISGHNHLVVGGYLQNGEDGYNELSELVLEAIADLPTFRPQASFRYTKKTTAETMYKITQFNRRCPLIVFVNDEPRIKGMVQAGIRREDALEYTVLGCNEWAICGKSELDLAHISLLHPLKAALVDRREEAFAARDFEAFYALFEDCLVDDMKRIVDDYTQYAEAKRGDINVLTSALMDDCIENARPFNDGGARYHGLSMSFNGVSNVTDALSVIREYVYEQKALTLNRFVEILDADWAGEDVLHAQIIKTGRFFGNGDAYADEIAQRVIESIEKTRKTLKSDEFNLLVCGSFVGGTLPNIVLGRMTPATPDGRREGEEFTMGVSQTAGCDRSGITALLTSIASIDYSKFCGCLVSNLKMDPRMADTPEKLNKISQMFKAFLDMGGMQLQINYISSEELKTAQACPEQYQNLMVRVTGYSGYFTTFERDLQNDIIKRTEYRNA